MSNIFVQDAELARLRSELLDADARSSAGLAVRLIEIKAAIKDYQQQILSCPVKDILDMWLSNVSQDIYWGQHYIECIRKLISKGILVLKNPDGTDRLIGDFTPSVHREVIEEIRCVKEWSAFEAHRLVSDYLQFSKALSEYTLNLILPGYDPDRERVASKLVEYNTFIEFIQLFSKRDVLISQIIYFGARFVDEVLDLCVDDVNIEGMSITLGSRVVPYQKYIMQNLKYYIQNKRGNDLVFTNFKGEKVSRAHLVNAFARRCAKCPEKFEITPATLLKSKFDAL